MIHLSMPPAVLLGVILLILVHGKMMQEGGKRYAQGSDWFTITLASVSIAFIAIGLLLISLSPACLEG